MIDSASTSHNNNSSTKFRANLVNVTLIIVFFFIWGTLYGLVNSWASVPGRAHIFVSPIEQHRQLFQPWAAVIYIFGGWLTLTIPFLAQWSVIGVRRVLLSMAVTCSMALFFYLAWPVIILRPDFLAPGLGSTLMRWFTSLDQPANTFPSGHAFFAVLAALWMQKSSLPGALKTGTWLLAVAIAISTILVGQHYFWDLAGGVVVGWMGYLTAVKSLPISRLIV